MIEKDNIRETKFRAWDELNECMMYSDTYLFEKGETGYDRGKKIGEFLSMILWHDWKKMDYVGIKDKNGKEIYDGDIVQMILSTGTIIHRNFVVSWNQTGCSWTIWKPLKCNGEGVWEVIGNIYENPELLKRRIYE